MCPIKDKGKKKLTILPKLTGPGRGARNVYKRKLMHISESCGEHQNRKAQGLGRGGKGLSLMNGKKAKTDKGGGLVVQKAERRHEKKRH